MERAKMGETAAVRAYLNAGGSPTVLVEVKAASKGLSEPLLHAVVCHSGHPHTELAECVEMLISAGADVDAKARQLDGSNKTALITAAEHTCCKQPLKILLDHGADPAQRLAAATQNVTPLHKAAALASAAHCRALLAAGSQRL
eukprot:8882-Heterococcus_DN1.PRE.1